MKDKNAVAFHPKINVLPTLTQDHEPDLGGIIIGFALSTLIASAFGFIPAIAVTAIVEEKESG